MVFHNRSNYAYHFIIKELTKQFEGKFDFLEGNTEIYKTFSVSIIKEVKRFGRNGEEATKTTSYKLQFVDNARFIVC